MVHQCKIKSCRTLGSKGFYGFPKNSIAITDEWKKVCEITEIKNSFKVCFRHFNREELVRKGNMFVPKQDAIPKPYVVTDELPSILDNPEVPMVTNVPLENNKPATSTESFQRSLSFRIQHQGLTKDFVCKEGKTVSELHDIIRHLGKCISPFRIPNIPKGTPPSTCLAKLKLPMINFIEVFCNDQACHSRFKTEVSPDNNLALLFQERIRVLELQAENEKLKKDLEKTRKSNLEAQTKKNAYKQRYKLMKEKFERHKNKPLTKKQRDQAVRDVLKDVFSEKQINCFLKGANWKQGRGWSQDDFALALTLRSLHKKTYRFLRSRRLLPMPGESTLRKYFQKFKINEGFIEPVATLLKLKAETLTEEERAIAISFDEVHVKRDISYDSQDDKILGPHSKANTMLIRGLFKNYKMPVWFRFDSALKKAELFEIIQRLEDLKYHVMSVTSDLGPDNRALAKELGITPEHSWFDNPAQPDKKVYVFFDVPHILKLIRNNLMEYGFIIPQEDGTFAPINKSMLMNIFEKIKNEDGHGEVTIAHKLNDEKIFDVRGQDKQRVYYAAKLLSETTSNAIKYFFPSDANMKVLADFVLATDRWFDVFNSSKEKAKKNMKCPYGVHLEEQTKILEDFRKLMLSMNVMNGKNAKMPFQIGAAISTTSLLHIRIDILNQYGISAIKTVAFNQDICENTFSRLRLMGGAENRFGALTFKNRLRDYILGSCKDLSVKTAAVLCTEESTKVLTAEISREFVEEQSREPAIVIIPDENDTPINELTEQILERGSAKRLPSVTFQFVSDDVDKIVELNELEIEENSASEQIELMPSENEGLIYVAGWLGKKHGDLVTSNPDEDENDRFASSTWVSLINRGDLCVPTNEFVNDIKKMDSLFRKFHKDAPGTKKFSFTPHDLLRSPKVVKSFYEVLISEFPNYHEKYPKILKRFAKSRTMFRMRHLQKLITQRESLRSKVTKLSYTY